MWNTKRWTLALAGATAGSLLLIGSAFAQQAPGGMPCAGWFGQAGVAGYGPGMYAQGSDAVATALGMSTQDLSTALRSGKSVATLAQEHGVSLDSLVQAAVAAHKSFLDQQVSAGVVTQAGEDQMLSFMEQRIRASFEASGIAGYGPGMMGGGYGPGMMGGRGYGPGMMGGRGWNR